MAIKLPDKLTFKRKEVINLTQLDGRVLDYWEREFSAFHPVVNQSDEKFYTRRDLEVILQIKYLLIEQKYEKSKVKELLKTALNVDQRAAEEKDSPDVKVDKLGSIKTSLQEILTILDKNDKK